MYLDTLFIKHPNICVVPKKELVCFFPFLGKKSLEIKAWLQNPIERTLPYFKLKVIFKSPSKVVKRFYFRDVLPKKFCSGIVYNSCNAIHYGKTNHHFYVRAAEHMGISHLTNERLKNVKQSVISDHMLTCDCNINFNDFNNINLIVKESLLIARDLPLEKVFFSQILVKLRLWELLSQKC